MVSLHIKIAERLHPFSHQSGTVCLIPKTTWEVQAFPTLLRFRNLQIPEHFEVKLHFKGPIKDFTLEQDLEKGHIHIYGMSQDGYIDYQIVREKNVLKLACNKVPETGVKCDFLDKSVMLHKGKSISLPIALQDGVPQAATERLSLGMHRSQDWTLVQRRMDLSEIFPIWLRLAALTPQNKIKELSPVGTLLLLQECKKAIQDAEKNKLKSLFTALFQTAFQGILAPRLTDEQFLGIIPEMKIPPDLSPLLVLKESATLIRELFFKESAKKIFLLTCLPPEMHSGRFVGIKTSDGDEINLEWSKKLLKKVIWRSATEKEITLELQRSIKSFRIRFSQKDHGKRVSVDEPLVLKAGQILYLDRFQK